METENKIQQVSGIKILPKGKVHHILAHSYSIQLVLFLVGVYLDVVLKFKISMNPTMVPVGFSVLIFGSFLIFWAQKTSKNLNTANPNKENFYHGPYRYTRSPTHFGLFFLMLGFGMMVNAPFVILFSFISFFISKLIFLKLQETALAEKYGTPYLEYKKVVRF